MQRKLHLVIVLSATVAASTAAAYAHHSVAALYDANKTIKIEGKLISFAFRSPHSVIIVEAPDDKGVMQRWDVAWNAARELANTGINRETFRPGDVVVITGNPGRKAEDHILKMVSFLRPSDGLAWGDKPSERFQ
jgi:hypothetical protein